MIKKPYITKKSRLQKQTYTQ